MNLDTNVHNINRIVGEDCPRFRNRLLVHSFNSPFPHHNLGKEFYVNFQSFNEDPGQWSVVSDPDDPLQPEGVLYEQETIVKYGENLLFFPIPFEMLETFETKP